APVRRGAGVGAGGPFAVDGGVAVGAVVRGGGVGPGVGPGVVVVILLGEGCEGQPQWPQARRRGRGGVTLLPGGHALRGRGGGRQTEAAGLVAEDGRALALILDARPRHRPAVIRDLADESGMALRARRT